MVQLPDLFLHSAKILKEDYQEEEFQINASIYIQIANVAHIFATASVTNYNEAKPPGIALETNQNP